MIEPTHKSPQNCQTQNLYFIINIILHINTISNVLWPRPMLYRLSVLCISISLALDNAFHSTNRLLDLMCSWKSRQAEHTVRWCFVVISRKFRFWLALWHHSTSSVIHREENTLNVLVGTRKRLRKLKCTRPINSCSIASYSICLDVKLPTTDGYIVSVPVPSLLCYQFQSERITETAKRSNVVNYLDSSLTISWVIEPLIYRSEPY